MTTRTPREAGSVRLGGSASRTPHRRAAPSCQMGATPDGGGEPRRAARVVDQLALRLLARDLLTRAAWALDGPHRRGGMTLGARFFRHGNDFHGLRVHQIRLQAEDASSDSSFWFVQVAKHHHDPTRRRWQSPPPLLRRAKTANVASRSRPASTLRPSTRKRQRGQRGPSLLLGTVAVAQTGLNLVVNWSRTKSGRIDRASDISGTRPSMRA
jgi:hypothetical protein